MWRNIRDGGSPFWTGLRVAGCVDRVADGRFYFSYLCLPVTGEKPLRPNPYRRPHFLCPSTPFLHKCGASNRVRPESSGGQMTGKGGRLTRFFITSDAWFESGSHDGELSRPSGSRGGNRSLTVAAR